MSQSATPHPRAPAIFTDPVMTLATVLRRSVVHVVAQHWEVRPPSCVNQNFSLHELLPAPFARSRNIINASITGPTERQATRYSKPAMIVPIICSINYLPQTPRPTVSCAFAPI
jgi:hypothetical protein